MSITFEKMQCYHLQKAAEIAKTAPDPWSFETLQHTMQDDNHQCFVAVIEENVVGFACFLAVCDAADLELVAVAENQRRKGIANAILLHSFDVLLEMGIQRLLLEARVSNLAAIELYKKLGFRQLALRKNMYNKPEEDGILMLKNL